MDGKDPPPFGYTFSGDFFGGSPNLENGAPSLLNDMETQELSDFFSQTPWSSDMAAYAPAAETKDAPDAFNTWSFVPPATIHSVSTTIPDQTQLHGFHNDLRFANPHAAHFGSTADDLQAASTLYNNAQMPHSVGRSYSFHGLPSSSTATNGHPSIDFAGIPMVPTSTGPLNEQIAALLPHHDAEGSIDASLAAQFANPAIQQQHAAQLREFGIHRPPLKRPYTYGTDSAFHESGFQVSSRHETEEFVVGRLMNDLQHGPLIPRHSVTNGDDVKMRSPAANAQFDRLVDIPSEEEQQSDEVSSDDEGEGRPAKKKRKGKASSRNEKGLNGSRKSISNGKNRKASVDDRVSKKKRGSVAGQKVQRENLSEEQKRSNHILSEQKRRNLIKRGFDDLHDLVPEIRNGGLSKSGVLTEAANFLEKLIEDNKRYLALMAAAEG